MAARSFMGSGDIFIESIVNGVGQGLEGPFYAENLSIQPNVERFEAVSKGRYDRGQVLETVLIQQPASLTLELKEIQGAVLAYALLGTTSTLTAASGTMADQAFVARKGKWVSLGHLRLGTVITIENSAGSTTYVEGTDYILNRPLGLVKILDASAIVDAASLLASGTYTGAAGTRIRGATQNEIRCRIVFDGVNQADSAEVTAEIYEAVLAAESQFDFMPDEFGTVTLAGTVKTPVGKNEPFIVDVKPAA